MEHTIQVTEQMARFIDWAKEKGEEEVRRMVQEHLDMLKSMDGKMVDNKFYKFDPALEQHDGVEQWKQGGDCNKCRKANYCMKHCSANKKLKAVTTPFLFEKFVEEHPEEIARSGAGNMSPEQMARSLGLIQ